MAALSHGVPECEMLTWQLYLTECRNVKCEHDSFISWSAGM